jgi:hypothetical protein
MQATNTGAYGQACCIHRWMEGADAGVDVMTFGDQAPKRSWFCSI